MGSTLAGYGGVEVRRVIDPSCGAVAAHAHDWPVLSIFLLGAYRNHTEVGELDVAGPSALLYLAGASHANDIGDRGFEQIEIEFDPDWIGLSDLELPAVSRWVTGPPAAASRRLARLCMTRPDETVLREGVQQFIRRAQAITGPRPPPWMREVEEMQRERPKATVAELARSVGLHPGWLGSAYARHRGETLAETGMRRQVESAAKLLRETDLAQSAIAIEAGFCDQSHMIRSFGRVLGRRPTAIRADRSAMRLTGRGDGDRQPSRGR
jgi:AraC family transcriptional regulator